MKWNACSSVLFYILSDIIGEFYSLNPRDIQDIFKKTKTFQSV